MAMAEGGAGVRASVGFCSDKGPRKQNEDFAAAVIGAELPEPRREVVAAIADGVGGAKGGRVAAELAVRGFLDGFWDLPETMEVRRAGARVISALNKWINAMGREDPELKGMACTFTALVLRGRVAHLLHIGDTRAYRLRRDRLTCLTADHAREGGPGQSRVLTRALGAEAEARLDYAAQPVALHDRFLLCSDGVHGSLTDESLAALLRERSAPDDTARALVAAALELRERRQLHGHGSGRGSPADGRLGRRRRRDHATAADPDAGQRRDDRRLCLESAHLRRPV